ncbi:TonB-dependent receptor-like protein [Luteibacter rhizovicinus]|uniref:TonB-dependent receptor-like protein n=1 Tax=Luteibacter rhizovicinus TaxID=242606 RepID=A0A4R3YQZ3_9GAMM|nr:TonB-dependent receptor [Luteibacter rhizovicinus]TCV94048.1 TonB-dependent receptor-like protein [Luteibacter rhizovicinus]
MIRSIHGRTGFLRPTALALALGLSIGGVAHAQSNASGVVFGRTAADAGTVVHLQNKDTGFSRDITVDADGRYRASSLPVGRYDVSVMRNGTVVQTREDVAVQLGTGTDVSFVSEATGAQTLEGVQVTGNVLPAIDVSSVDSRTVLTSEQLQKLPIARDVTSAALLAPGAVGGDSRYGNVASFGGASAAENQYYVNGYAVTNALTGLGLTSLPYDAIDQQQIYTGGYGAEYGRSTGGVVNMITKRGGNTFKAGGQIVYTPTGLRDSPRDIYLVNGQLYQDRARNKSWNTEYSAYISGPLIKDKLFFYLTGDFIKQEGMTIGSTAASTHTDFSTKTSRYLAKVDWNITDSHLLELTGFSDKTTNTDQIYAYNYATGTRGAYRGSAYTKNYGTAGATPGGDVYIAKYTGYITDNLTINALYGRSTTEHVQTTNSVGGSCPLISGSFTVGGQAVFPPSCYLVGQLLAPGAKDKTHGWRLDAEYRIGDHDIRAGLDNQTLQSFAGNSYEGPESGRGNGGSYYWSYGNANKTGTIQGYPDVLFSPNQRYVQRVYYYAASNVETVQEAQFIEDHWQVTDRWLAYVGLRNEQFKNINGGGDVYVKQRHQLAPRLGVSWDVFGDSTLKIYGNAGRYHLAIPSNVAVRAASGSYYLRQFGSFDSIDPVTGAPIGFKPNGKEYPSNGHDGTNPDSRTIAAKGMGAYYQDEYILGFDKMFDNNWTVGAKGTYRKLKSSIDDFCDSRPFTNWGKRNSVDMSKAVVSGCYLFNPGKANTFQVNMDGKGTFRDVTLTKEDFTNNGIGFPELKRKYVALNLYAEHQFNQQWYGKVDYVWSHSYGNSEGMLKSDIGQRDPSVTQDWDAPELMVGSNGSLPNDRKHQLKAYGYYQYNPEWLFSANLTVASGRPVNCLGVAPGDPVKYGAAYFYCDGKVSPRGSRGRLPWTEQLNLGAEYRPAFADHKLAFNVDVFNVFTQQRKTSVIEVGENSAGAPVVTYLRPASYSAPRYFRFAVRYDL